ncbi:MAG: hypothetical protein RL885_25585 [Planctomycetota bacterium]
MPPATPTTIGQLITLLAHENDSSDEFAEQVRQLFLAKGIALDHDASPYTEAIHETFDRDRSLRHNVLKARAAAEQLQQDIEDLSEKCRVQLDQLTRLSQAFQGQFPQLQAFADRLKELRYYLAEFYVR